MDVYLPIANLSVNGLIIVGLGVLTGVLSGLFGVGGGFLTTPLLIFYGVPPTVAAASAASQVTGASVSGVFAHSRRGGVDYQMGGVLVAGGVIGTGFGALLFRLLERLGQIDTVINILYVVLLGSIGALMARESIQTIRATRSGQAIPARKRRHHPLVASLPLRWRFYKSGLYISPLAPLLLGVATGILTMLMGIGGGFVLVPAMLYILGMSAGAVVGTSLFQILFVTMATTMMHALTTKAVDIVLAAMLLIGSVTGAQLGAQFAQKASPVYLRLALAAIVLLVALRLFLGLTYRPDEIYTVSPAVRRLIGLLALVLLTGARDPILVPEVSQHTVEVRQDFTGTELLLFGAILNPEGTRAGGDYDIAVVLKGPIQSVLVREKSKVAGLWINADSTGFRSAPLFYAVASSRPIRDIVDERTAAIYELGLPSLQLSPIGTIDPDAQKRFSAGLVDLNRRGQLYQEQRRGVKISEQVLYQARIALPSSVPTGSYTAETFAIQKSRVVASAISRVEVRKLGFEGAIVRFAEEQSFWYGLMAVSVSVLMGWMAGRLFALV